MKNPLAKSIAMAGAIFLMAAVSAQAIVVSQPTATKGNYASFIYVTWSANAYANRGYYVYRTSTGKFVNPVRLGSTTGRSWIDRTALSGRKYWYWIAPRNSNGYYYPPYKNTSAKTCQGGWRTFTIPTPTVARGSSTSGLYLYWSASPQAKYGYRIYRSTRSSGGAVCVGTTTRRYFTDTTAYPGRTYYYWIFVRGYNVTVYQSGKWGKGWLALSVPTPSVTAYSGYNKISWTSVRGAQKYKLYVGTSSSWSSATCWYTTSSASTRTLYHRNPVHGRRYYYWVCPVDIEGDRWYRASGWRSVVSR